jgi:steroid delta-isomerase-like uncharacterized protein
MSTKENIKLINKYNEEILRRGNMDKVEELLANDYEHGTPPAGMSPTREGFKEFISMVHRGFSDYDMTVKETISEGDMVVQRWTATGTHDGEFLGLPPSEKEIKFDGTSVYQIKDGKIQKDWTIADMMGMMQQIGAIPETM